MSYNNFMFVIVDVYKSLSGSRYYDPQTGLRDYRYINIGSNTALFVCMNIRPSIDGGT